MTSSIAPEARVLGDFALRDKLGEGGFGTVYRAVQRTLDRAAVVKVMRRSLAASKTAIERFTLEAKLASRFDHPYAAHVYAFGAEPDGLLWIAMELVRGTPLNEMIAQTGAMPPERFLPLAERLCEVVQAAHDQGIVHRDIKPSNVMVIARSGRLLPKLLDFGIAKVREDSGEALPGALPNRSQRAHRSTAQSFGGDAPSQTPVELDHTAAATADPDATANGSLTLEGQILGSPLYMAPEQWLDASRVGPWTDQYALAMLAYEVLTGAKPFQAATLSELLVHHTEDPLPTFEGLPPAIHAVLARAAAKDPTARFANLTDFAAALRAAIAPAEDPEARVELPAALAAWVADAPRPLAEALALVASARTAIRIVDRVAVAAGGIARWLGVLAVACRSRLGRLDDSADVALLRELRRRPLRDEEWLDLAVALTRLFVERPAAWPVPELVGFLAEGAALAELRALVRGDASLVAVARDGSVERATAIAKLGQLATVLDGLAWLLDYELGREIAGGLELWMGTATDDEVVRILPNVEATDRVVMLDADGAPVVVLSPLVRVASPSAGEAAELFQLAGPGRAPDTARFVASPRGFELEADDAWPWLAAHVLAGATASARAGGDDERSPYPGLTAFTGDDHASFVGREREVEELLNRLRTQAMVAVVGPSGVGKSSFLAAGVARALPATWVAHVVRPGDDPLGALAAILEREVRGPYRGQTHSEAARDGLGDALAQLAARTGQTLAILVDQAEELFTMCEDDAARTAFAAALATAARSSQVRVIVGVRDDFLCRLDELAPWRGTLARAVQILRVPDAEALARIVATPAARRGYTFDDPALPREIADAVASRPGALPLLAFAAAELWARRDRHFHRLTRAAYIELRGVTGALVRHADGTVDALSAPDRRLVRLAFRRLLTAEGTRALVGRSELIAALGDTPAAARVVERLLAARLIVSRDHDAGERVEIVHEALVTMWPRLAAWRAEDDAGMRIHQQLAIAAVHWEERGRDHGLLWRGEALGDLRRWRAYSELGATPTEAAFADASEQAWRSARRRRMGAIGGALAVLGTGVVVLGAMTHAIARQKAEAVQRLAANLEERGRLAIVADDAARGLVYLVEARRLGAGGEPLDDLLARGMAAVDSQTGLLVHQAAGIGKVRFDAMTAVVVDASSSVQVWDRATRAATGPTLHGIADAFPVGAHVVLVDLHGNVAAIERDGTARWRAAGAHVDSDRDPTVWYGVTGSAAGGVALSYGPTARLWSVDDGRPRGELATEAAITSAAFDASGVRVATGEITGGVRVWDATTGAPLATCTAHAGRVRALKFSADGALLVSGGDDGKLQLCTPASGALVRRLEGHATPIVTIDLAGARLASGGTDGTARLWDLATGLSTAKLEGHPGAIVNVRFSPDGQTLATAGVDSVVRLWDAEAGILVGTLQGGSATPVVDWEPDGHSVLTAGMDGTVRRWDVDRARRGRLAKPHAGSIGELVRSPDGRWLATIGEDGLVITDARTLAPRAALHALGSVGAARFALDSQSVVVTQDSGAVAVLDLDGKQLRALPGTSFAIAEPLPDGTIATVDGDGVMRWWSTAGAELAHVGVGFVPGWIAVDPAHRYLVPVQSFGAGKEPVVQVIDAATHAVVARLTGERVAHFVTMSATHLAATDGNVIRTWELGTWRPAATLVGHQSEVSVLAYLPDGRLVSGADDQRAMVWRDGQLAGALPASGRVFAIATADDGATFATGSLDGAVRVWDPATQQPLLVQPSHHGMARGVVYASGGVVSSGSDGRVARWELPHAAQSLDALERVLRCRVPFRLEDDALLPRALDFDAPTCR